MNTIRIATVLVLVLSTWAGPTQAQDQEDIVGVASGAGIFNTLGEIKRQVR